jgi:hypothetical protein
MSNSQRSKSASSDEQRKLICSIFSGIFPEVYATGLSISTSTNSQGKALSEEDHNKTAHISSHN